MHAMSECIARLEAAVQRDEGGRGLVDICLPRGELEAAALALYHHCNHHREDPLAGAVIILTGFPCLLQHMPPTETDGPPGALALSRVCVGLGKHVVLVIEETNAAVLQAAMVAADLPPALLRLETFPPLPRWTPTEDTRLQAISQEAGFIVAIERAGPSVSDGHYYTMRGLEMDAVLAPLERLLDLVPSSVVSVGIGDGGNEVGMGKVQQRVLGSTRIPNAAKIACRTATAHLIAASVSNWGAYALCCALAVVAAADDTTRMEGDVQRGDDTEEETRQRKRREWVEKLVVTDVQEATLLETIVAAGARDGLTGERQAWVDGMPGEKSLEVLRGLRHIALQNE